MGQAPDPSGECDLAVVGAGIVGLAVAREALSRRPDSRVVVLEREAEVGLHQTGRNSGVVHAGVYYAPGSLKARLCAAGARELYDYCDSRGIPATRCGKLIVAADRGELARLHKLEWRARANGVPGLRRLGRSEIREVEPHAQGIAALHSPATGVVDFRHVARALATDVTAAGGTVATSCAAASVEPGRRALGLRHADGETVARRAVFCAGPWSDRLAAAAGAPAEPRIVPFRGAYLRLRPERRDLVRALIYPVPDPGLPFLGVHLTRHPAGQVLVGPTSRIAATRDVTDRRPRVADLRATLSWPGSWRLAASHWRAGLLELRRAAGRGVLAAEAARYVPEIEASDLLPAFSGVRAQALARDGTLLDDFVVSETERAVHVRNAPSPAASSSLALARLIMDRVERLP
ncbi:MAG: L-2-hydroxyglutarate oxidase [Thermoleophilaceae bacterium]